MSSSKGSPDRLISASLSKLIVRASSGLSASAAWYICSQANITAHASVYRWPALELSQGILLIERTSTACLMSSLI